METLAPLVFGCSGISTKHQKTHEIMKELNDGVQKLDGLSSDVVL